MFKRKIIYSLFIGLLIASQTVMPVNTKPQSKAQNTSSKVKKVALFGGTVVVGAIIAFLLYKQKNRKRPNPYQPLSAHDPHEAFRHAFGLDRTDEDRKSRRKFMEDKKLIKSYDQYLEEFNQANEKFNQRYGDSFAGKAFKEAFNVRSTPMSREEFEAQKNFTLGLLGA